MTTRAHPLTARLTLFPAPSPVRAAPELGEDVWVKDDAAIGGNKVRKLEYTLADARRRGRRSVLTFGAAGSHHALATAEVARALGMSAVLALVDQPESEHGAQMRERLAASGARVLRTRTTARTLAALPWLLARHRPYVLPVGGSSALGVLGFAEAAIELAAQVAGGRLPEPATIVVAAGSGGTAAGLHLGLGIAGLRSRVLGVLVNDRTRVDPDRLARRAARRIGAPEPAGGIAMTRDFLGPGYGHETPQAARAIALARAAGLELEPVYSGKALAALLELRPPGPVLFWQTYAPAVPSAAD